MLTDTTKWPVLDTMLGEYASELPDGDRSNLLTYTGSLHRAWRSVLQMLQVPPDLTVLDVGTGYGLLAFELCAQAPMRVVGLDLDLGLVRHADELSRRLRKLDYFTAGSDLAFGAGDIMDLPVRSSSFEFTVVREVFQFLPDPTAAVDELVRVTLPGGHLCVSDMDDQLYLTHPGPTPAFRGSMQRSSRSRPSGVETGTSAGSSPRSSGQRGATSPRS